MVRVKHRTDMELAIISSVNKEFGGVKHRYCQWHMMQAWSRRLNSKGKNGYRVLDENVMKTRMPILYNILQSLPIIPIRKKKQNVLIHELIDKERRKVKKVTEKRLFCMLNYVGSWNISN